MTNQMNSNQNPSNDQQEKIDPKRISQDQTPMQEPDNNEKEEGQLLRPQRVSIHQEQPLNPQRISIDQPGTPNPQPSAIDQSETPNPQRISIDQPETPNPQGPTNDQTEMPNPQLRPNTDEQIPGPTHRRRDNGRNPNQVASNNRSPQEESNRTIAMAEVTQNRKNHSIKRKHNSDSRPIKEQTNTKTRPVRDRVKKTLRKRVNGKPSRSESNSLLHSITFIIRRSLTIAVILILIIAFLGAGVGTGLLAGYISTAKAIDTSGLQNFNQTTVLLDKNGNELTELTSSGSRSKYVSYHDFSSTYIDEAFISIEDERFMQHPGIDAKRIASSIFSAIANGGTPTHGGSTITQQTIKMVSGADDISAQRKIQEWYSAIELEKTVSKEGILELYLNLVPMANNITGIGAAANYYFNKEISQLNLLECAFLAGIPNQPSIYNPMTEYGRRNSLRRMRMTLSKMAELGAISQAEYEEALNQELEFDFTFFEEKDDVIYSWFEEYVIDSVIADLITKNGYSPELARLTVFNQGLTIETTVDPVVQNRLEQLFQDATIRSKDPTQMADSPESPQASMTVLENNPNDPGRIRALIGGFGQKRENFIFNRATDAYRQPASSIKPLVVYGPALDVGIITDASRFEDRPVQLDPYRPGVNYPENSYRSYLGNISLQTALINSTNTVAADIFMNYLTPEVGLTYLKNLGIDRMQEQYPATALGGLETGVNTLQMSGAFNTFANKGIYVTPSCYTRVLRHDGTVLLDNSAPLQTPVFKPGTATIITKNLEKVAANIGATPSNMHAAGKTGTSEDMNDLWFCGYTPYYTAALWYGYDNTNGRKIAVPEVDTLTQVDIWNKAMTAINEGLEDRPFDLTEGVYSAEVCSESGGLATAYCPETHTALFIDGVESGALQYCPIHTAEATTTTTKKETESSEENTSESEIIITEPTEPPTEPTEPPTEPTEPPTEPTSPPEPEPPVEEPTSPPSEETP